MQLEIPFYPMPVEHKNYCGQYVLKCIFSYLLNKEYDVEHLAKISKKFEGGFTLTVGLAYAALQEGMKAKLFTKDADLVSDTEVDDIGKSYGGKKLSEVQIAAQTMLADARKAGLEFAQKETTLDELLEELDKKHPIVVIIDYGKIYKVDRQVFHFALLTGYDDENIYFHDVGPNKPTPNKKIDRATFLTAWDAPGTDRDTAIFYR